MIRAMLFVVLLATVGCSTGQRAVAAPIGRLHFPGQRAVTFWAIRAPSGQYLAHGVPPVGSLAHGRLRRFGTEHSARAAIGGATEHLTVVGVSND